MTYEHVADMDAADHQRSLLANALREVLVAVGVFDERAAPDGPNLLLAAQEFVAQPDPPEVLMRILTTEAAKVYESLLGDRAARGICASRNLIDVTCTQGHVGMLVVAVHRIDPEAKFAVEDVN